MQLNYELHGKDKHKTYYPYGKDREKEIMIKEKYKGASIESFTLLFNNLKEILQNTKI